MPTATFTLPTPTTTRSRSATSKNRSVKSLVGSHTPGDSDNPPQFYQPGGLSAADSHLYVADTNNHKIRVVDLKTNAVKTLAFDGLSPPRLAPQAPTFPNATVVDVPAVQAAAGKSITLAVTVPLAKGFKLNEEAPLVYLVETPDKTGILAPEVPPEGQRLKPQVPQFNVTVPLAKAAVAGESLATSILAASLRLQGNLEPLPDQELRLECADHVQCRREPANRSVSRPR